MFQYFDILWNDTSYKGTLFNKIWKIFGGEKRINSMNSQTVPNMVPIHEYVQNSSVLLTLSEKFYNFKQVEAYIGEK